MNLSAIHSLSSYKANPLSRLAKSNMAYATSNLLCDDIKMLFDINILSRLDDVFYRNNTKYLTIEQENFIRKFIKEAGYVTDNLNNGNSDSYADMDKLFIQLDNYLGSWVPEAKVYDVPKKDRDDYGFNFKPSVAHEDEFATNAMIDKLF